MNTRTCEYIIAIAENRSLSKAASVLGVSQPTLSNFLSILEKQIGHRLFTRQSKTLIQTEAGRIYVDACRRIIHAKKHTYHSIMALTESCSERLAIGITPHRGSTMFGRIFPTFYHRHPDVYVHIEEGYLGTLLKKISSGEINLAIGTISEFEAEDISIAQHDQEELLLCVPDFHPLASEATPAGKPRVSIDIRLFQDTPFIMWGELTTNWRIIQRLFDEKDFAPTTVYESNNVLIIDSMLASGVGVGFLPAVYCKLGQNRVYFSMNPPIKSCLGVIYKKSTLLTESQRYFIYLSIRDRLLYSVSSQPDLNEIAKNIFNEFNDKKGADNGHTPT